MSGLQSDVKKNPLTRSHTVYKIGKQRLPSVTTIIGNLGWKYPALMAWQKRTLLAGEDPQSIAQEAAKAGTLAHTLMEEHFTGGEVDLSFFSEDQVAKAQRAYRAFQDWLSGVHVIPIMAEEHLTHKRLRYGGTADFVCSLNGVFTLVDYKTSRAVYSDHRIQLAAYRELIKHRYGEQPDTWILRTGREGGEFEAHHYPDLDDEFQVFRLCLKLHSLKKEVA